MIARMAREFLINMERRFHLRQAVAQRLRNRRFWRDSSLLMLANAIVTALGLARTPAMTWLLPKEEVGMLAVAASWLPFLQILSLSGLDSAAYHYVAKGQPWAFAVNLAYRLRWSLLSAAGFLAGAAYWMWLAADPSPALAGLFVIAGLTYPVTIGLSACSGMLGAQERFGSLFWYRIWESLTDFSGFIPLLLSTWWLSQAATFYGANQLATAVMQVGYSLWLLRLLRRSQAVQPQAAAMPPAEEREMLRYGKHLTVMNAIGVLQTRTDALLVATFLPLATAADYSIALLAGEQFKRLWIIYLSVRYPPLVRLPAAQRVRRLVAEGTLVWAGFGLTGGLLAILLQWLIPILLPPSYRSSLFFIHWLIAGFVVSIPGLVAETYFRTEQDEKQQYRMRIAAAVAGVALPAAFIGVWGASGVVVARFLAGLTLSVFGVWLAWVQIRLKR